MIRTILSCLFACLSLHGTYAQSQPSSVKATPETKNLYANLQRLQGQGILFGHQDDLAYGVGWKYEPGRSDVKEVAGQYPAVYGWDLGHIELNSPANLDSVPFEQIRRYAEQVYARGGLNTFSWHLNNPLDPAKTSWDPVDSTIHRLFADPKALAQYTAYLDKVASFFSSLRGERGELIPVVFRPLHEHTGSWFWWGREHVSPEDYKKMWRFTVDYLRRKNVNNLLYAYSTDRFSSKEDYLERYPGDDFVDIVGFDIYHRPSAEVVQAGAPDTAFIAEARRMVETLGQIGREKHKVWALTETGLQELPVADWWTNTLLPVVQNAGLSYVLVWRNARTNHFFAPYKGQKSAADFRKFAQRPQVLLQKKAAAANLYSPPPAQKGQAEATKQK